MKNFYIKDKLNKTFGLGINKIAKFSEDIGLNMRKDPKYVRRKHLTSIKLQCKELVLGYELKTAINYNKSILEKIQTHRYSKLKNKKLKEKNDNIKDRRRKT